MLEEALGSFGISGKPIKLTGGQGQSVRVGNFVIKPIEEIDKYCWAGAVLESISNKDIMISKPLRSRIGNFVELGYGITQFIEGDFKEGKINEKIKACQRLNQLLDSVKPPQQWSNWSSAWQSASKVAWQEAYLPDNTDIRSVQILEAIKILYKPVNLPSQLIHSDLAGNILFNEDIPVIIDFSPDFRPAAYAEILMITDSIAWHNAPTNSLWRSQYPRRLIIQLALRAIVFRLAVVIHFHPANHNYLLKELKNFQPILNILQ